MAKEKGWIMLHRKLQESPDYFRESFCRNMAWIDLLLLANHKENSIRVRGIRIKIERGQVGLSVTELALRWKWSKGKVIRFLNELELDEQVGLQKNNITTLISILNYMKYQGGGFAEDTSNSTTDGTQTGSQAERRRNAEPCNDMETNALQAPNNDNNVNNDKEEIRGRGDLASPQAPTPEKAVLKAADGSLVIIPTLSFDPSYFNGIPDAYCRQVISLLKNLKNIEVEPERIKGVWESFKVLEMNKKLYRSEEEVYSFFSNFCKRQTWGKDGTPKLKTTKASKKPEKVVGIKFSDDFTKCEMSDGSIQDLTDNQMAGAKYNQINPVAIVKI